MAAGFDDREGVRDSLLRSLLKRFFAFTLEEASREQDRFLDLRQVLGVTKRAFR